MSDEFETQLTVLTLKAVKLSERIIKRHYDMTPLPALDSRGIPRIGWNHPVDRRPLPPAVATQLLQHNLFTAKAVLSQRVMYLMAKNPVSELRLAVLYVLADLLEPERVRDWAPLWHALEQGAWADVVAEMLNCNWAGLVGSTDRHKALFSALISALLTDSAPTNLS